VFGSAHELDEARGKPCRRVAGERVRVEDVVDKLAGRS
jgi:uncharacterized protein (DUF433 family)